MKCSIDNKSPRQATHLRTKAKKNALMEERIDQIETENRLLLEKMSHIMRVSKIASDLFEFINRSLNLSFINSQKAVTIIRMIASSIDIH